MSVNYQITDQRISHLPVSSKRHTDYNACSLSTECEFQDCSREDFQENKKHIHKYKPVLAKSQKVS